MEVQNNILDQLSGFGLKEKKRHKAILIGFYLHGSLVNLKGEGFDTEKSDIDLLIAMDSPSLINRVEFLKKLKPDLFELEKGLQKLLQKRKILPVTSFCIATAFELNEGIHKNRNSRNAYVNLIFRPLLPTSDGLAEEECVPVGGRLRDDMVDIHFLAWTILADAQAFRSKFVSVTAELKPEVQNHNTEFLPLPKSLLRSSYLYSCFAKNTFPEMSTEDDIATGIETIIDLLKSELSIDDFAKELYTSIRSSLGKVQKGIVTPEQQLYLWELLSLKTEIMLKNRRLSSEKDTLNYAASIVAQELTQLGVTDLEAVDMAIELYQGPPDLIQGTIVPIIVRPHLEIKAYEFDKLDHKTLDPLIQEWPQEIQNYLEKRVKTEGTEVSKCKVGFAGISYTRAVVEGEQIKLLVRPLTYWITQQFNKEMAANPTHPELSKLRKIFAEKLFKSTEDFKCLCPSSLYLEMVLVTSDDQVPIFTKSTKFSAFGKRAGEPVFTCGIETGFVWKKHVDEDSEGNGQLKLEKALFDGLKDELSINEAQVKSWSVKSLAIQHAHLNAALLGIVTLKLTRLEMSAHYEKYGSTYFENLIEFLPAKEALLRKLKDKETGKWHQSALMRLKLLID